MTLRLKIPTLGTVIHFVKFLGWLLRLAKILKTLCKLGRLLRKEETLLYMLGEIIMKANAQTNSSLAHLGQPMMRKEHA